MFKKKYLLLELDPFDAEFYHLPSLVPYFEQDQKKLEKDGFSWDVTILAMQALLREDNCDEYKLFKLFLRKWDHYQSLTQNIQKQDWAEAKKNIDKILAIDLLDPSAYYNLGYIFRCTEDYLKSQQAYQKGLELVKFKEAFYWGLAKTYEAIGKIEDAIYFWHEVYSAQENLDKNFVSVNAILLSAYQNSLDKLIEYRVFKNTEIQTEQKSFIEFAKTSKNSRAIYEQEMPEEIQSKSGLEPDINYERLMRRIFEKNFNDVDRLNKLGLELVHHKLTAFAVRVFERVYQLTLYQDKQIAKASSF